MRTRRLTGRRAAGAVALALLAGVATSALSAPPNALPTNSTKLADKAVTKKFPVYDAKGKRRGTATWRLTKAGGNCCEVLVATTSTGRIVEFGGTYPIYSDDQGRTWTEIQPLTPSTSRVPNPGPRQVGGGEGTIVMAPGGDIIGVGWDPYSGDRLQSFLFEAATGKWYYGESPLHEPFYDREWVAVAKGPFVINGQEVPWVSMVLSNFHRSVVLMSTDGINYFKPSARQIDTVRGPAVERFLPVTRDAEMDYLQEHSETNLVPLAGGYALSLDNGTVGGCSPQLLRSDGTWACFSFPNEEELDGRLHVDSRGWMHLVRAEGTSFVYRLSKDGGRSWQEREFVLPGEPSIESWDFKAHGKLGLTAIVAHAKKEGGNFQDYVMRVDTKAGRLVHRDTMLVGDGNEKFTSGLDVSSLISGAKTMRVDFATVAILPNGKIVAGFADKTYDDPAVAVLVGG